MLCVLSFWSEVSYKGDPYKECCVFCPSGVRFLIKGILIKNVVCFRLCYVTLSWLSFRYIPSNGILYYVSCILMYLLYFI